MAAAAEVIGTLEPSIFLPTVGRTEHRLYHWEGGGREAERGETRGRCRIDRGRLEEGEWG